MSFELHHRKHIEDELTKIARRQLRKTACALTTSDGGEFRTTVHESRKNVKKVRAIAAFLTQAGGKLPRKDRKRLKLAARALSRVRDSSAIIDTFDRLRGRYPKQLSEHTYGILRRGLVAARDRSEARAQRDGVVAEAAERLAKTRKSARKWIIPFDQVFWHRCDRRRLVSSESKGDETGARDRAIGDAPPLAQRAENPLVSAASG
jgi:hypothetical protein